MTLVAWGGCACAGGGNGARRRCAEYRSAVPRRGGTAFRRGRGFTLVELLVVLGVITVMISLLLPALTKARKQAAMTKCLAQMRELGIAVGQYLNENGNVLPEAVASDSPDDPAAVAGAMASIDKLLAKYLTRDYKIWRCPAQPVARRYDGFRVRGGEFYAPGFTDGAGYPKEARFVPGYMYLGTKGHHLLLSGEVKGEIDPAKYWLRRWVIRNVAGLKLSTARAIDAASASDVCLFMDYRSTFHSRSEDDVYDLGAAGRRGNFVGNFVFLDGHGEARRYNDVRSLIDQVHLGIRQKAFGVDFYEAYRAEYDKR